MLYLHPGNRKCVWIKVYLQWTDYLKSEFSASILLEFCLSVLLFFHRYPLPYSAILFHLVSPCLTVKDSILLSYACILLNCGLHMYSQGGFIDDRPTESVLHFCLSVYSSQCRKMLPESQTHCNCNRSKCHWFILYPCAFHKALLKSFLIIRGRIIAPLVSAKFIKQVRFIVLQSCT